MIGQDREKANPRTNLGAVLLRHDPRDLRDVSEIVHHPRRQELPERDGTEAGVLAPQVQLRVGEIPGPQDLQCPGPIPY